MDSRPLTKLLASPITKLTWLQVQQIKPLSPTKSKGMNKLCANGVSTSMNHNFWNKLTTYDQQQFQVPADLYVHRAEVEPVLVEGTGWAGQPIVRRTHPILPEVYGDLSDVITAVEKLPGSSKAHEEALQFSETNGVKISDNTQLQAVNLETKEGSPKNHQYVKEYLVDTIKTKEGTEVKTPSRKHDAYDENIKRGSCKYLYSKEADSVTSRPILVKDTGGFKSKTEAQVITQTGLKTKKDKRIKKIKNVNLNSGFVLMKQKKKSKKKTKVCSFKEKLPLLTKTKINKSKKKNMSTFGVNKKKSLQPNVLLSQRTQPARKSVIILANRQLQTFSRGNQAKVSISVKEKTSTTLIALAKKQNKNSKLESDGKYPEDCKCPELLEEKTRLPTKICGEASGGAQGKNKKKEWKGKMCPIEYTPKHRRRTFVCSSAKFGKAKRKRQLPKCVKPEKMIAPRVIICPPILEDELMKKKEKKCVKQVEEIKVRSRTKVCKPIVIHQREEAKVIIEKSVCTEKKVKKTISRHTKVCPPQGSNGDQKKAKR